MVATRHQLAGGNGKPLDTEIIEPDGLLYAFVLDANGGGTRLDWAGLESWSETQGKLWVHLDRTGERAQQWLRDRSGIDTVHVETLIRREGNRPRVHRVGDALLISLRGVNRVDGESLEDMPAMHMWVEQDRVITLRRRRLLAGNQMYEDIEAKRGPKNTSALLLRMAEYLIDPIIPAVAELDDSIDALQVEVLTHHDVSLRRRLQSARQEAISFRRHIAPQRDALSRLQSETVSWLDPLDRSRLRELADYTARYVEDLDAARERAGVAQDELNNQLAERMNKTMYLLTIISALLLPPALLTGLFGINVGGMPGVENANAFAIIAISIPVLAVIEFWVFRWLKWI